MSECRLCRAIQQEKPLYEDDECIIVPTLFMKGHRKRVMIISKDHFPNQDKNDHLMQTLIKFGQVYFDQEPTFAICEPTYCSIPEHWHRIACDWYGDDMCLVHYTPHIALPTNICVPSRDDPKLSKLEGLYRLGIYVLEMIWFGVRR